MKFENEKDVKEWLDTYLPQIDVKKVLLDVKTEEVTVTIQFKKNLSEYIKERAPKMLIFISGGNTYKAYKFYINTGDGIRTIYILKNGDKIIDVISLYEFLNYEKFANKYLTLSIDRILVKE